MINPFYEKLAKLAFNDITLIDDIASIERKRCIGCGNFISLCPSEAINLQKKEQKIIPPPTIDDLYNLIQEEKNKMKK
ncbi:MAG: hypothetical protein ACFE9C_15865 [Candidatus Hodarchaeota archaeon]